MLFSLPGPSRPPERLPTVPETLLKKRKLQQSLKDKKSKAREAALVVRMCSQQQFMVLMRNRQNTQSGSW